MDRDAFAALVEMTGFDLRMFSSSLEKLIAYIGTRSHITRADVESILLRTKKDPLYEFTGALGDRDLKKALQHLHALLSAGFYPLQILAAMTNQMRKLLLAKDFVQSPGGKAWQKGASYGAFTGRTLPAVMAHDEALAERLATWEAAAAESAEATPQTRGPKTKGGGKSKTDLFLAKTAKNPYPVYQLLLKCDKYRLAELQQALTIIREADLSLKTTPQPAAIILEAAVLKICQPRGH
jgi:DNA polymerase-3 subunit delta